MLKSAAVGVLTVLSPAGSQAANNPVQIGIVGKVRIPWFDNVEKGVLKAGKELGVDATMIIPTEADAAQQVRAVEDLIAKKVDVIGVIPNDGAALEPVWRAVGTRWLPVHWPFRACGGPGGANVSGGWHHRLSTSARRPRDQTQNT